MLISEDHSRISFVFNAALTAVMSFGLCAILDIVGSMRWSLNLELSIELLLLLHAVCM